MHVAAGRAQALGRAQLPRQEKVVHMENRSAADRRYIPRQRRFSAGAAAVQRDDAGLRPPDCGQQRQHARVTVIDHPVRRALGGAVRFAVMHRAHALREIRPLLALPVRPGKRQQAAGGGVHRFQKTQKALPAVLPRRAGAQEHFPQPGLGQTGAFPGRQVHPAGIRRERFGQRLAGIGGTGRKLVAQVCRGSAGIAQQVLGAKGRLIAHFQRVPGLHAGMERGLLPQKRVHFSA